MKIYISRVPPDNQNELLYRANALVGYTLGELATYAGLIITDILNKNKGWIGMLLERYLGACAGSKSEPDFSAIGVELKTIPVNWHGRPTETTFVCMATMTGNYGITWEKCYLRYKLKRVLWIPIVEVQKDIPLSYRRIGIPILWSPNVDEERQLKYDWEELMNLIVLGSVEQITAHYGEVLQLRKKATNSNVLTKAFGEYGQRVLIPPRGFYLKKTFTLHILERASLCHVIGNKISV